MNVCNTKTDILNEIKRIADLCKSNKDKLNCSEQICNLAKRYYNTVPYDDMIAIGAEVLYKILFEHYHVIHKREKNKENIKVFNPSFVNHTIIAVSTEDMPFLVDSICMAIDKLGFKILLMMHMGGVYVERDNTHVVKNIDFDRDDDINYTNEAVIWIEIDKKLDKKSLENIKSDLYKVLFDVRIAVQDWQLMLARILETAHLLETDPPVNSNEKDRVDSIKFLRWLANNFTFVGARDYELITSEQNPAGILKIIPNSSLGILRDEGKSKKERSLSTLTQAAQEIMVSNQILIISKTNTKSTIHRSVYTDYIGIKIMRGNSLIERRFIGLFTSKAYNSHPTDVPLISSKIDTILDWIAFPKTGHSDRKCMDVLATLPRDILFQASISDLTQLTFDIVIYTRERQQLKFFLYQDDCLRFAHCLVYMPKSYFNTIIADRIQDFLSKKFNALDISYSTSFHELSLVCVYYLIRTDAKTITKMESANINDIEKEIIKMVKPWRDKLEDLIRAKYNQDEVFSKYIKYKNAFPTSYKAENEPSSCLKDIVLIDEITPVNQLNMSINILENNIINLRLFHFAIPIVLSKILHILENFGLEILDERSYAINLEDNLVYLHSLQLRINDSSSKEYTDEVMEIFKIAFSKVLLNEIDNDCLNKLILTASLNWYEVMILRVYVKYMKQNSLFSEAYITSVLTKHSDIAKYLTELFINKFIPINNNIKSKGYRFSPEVNHSREEVLGKIEKKIFDALDAIKNIDEDKLLRDCLNFIQATVRTNYFQDEIDNKSSYVIKLLTKNIPNRKHNKIFSEIYVFSKHVEGIHLRTSKVARGGIRWSDREDFFEEIANLMETQDVKNSIIIPSGAKGGFVIRKDIAQLGKEELKDLSIFCYKIFISGILSVTDNIINSKTITPANVIAYDDHDPYMVVAADKGTANFSDIANAISIDAKYWLHDAFASGGKHGYDHKKMGITSRGAWESAKMHFLNVGINPEKDTFTVVGIGDMSGDVFGNGMLLSNKIKLVAAFNGLHIFIDPNPDPVKSYEERKRLFNLPQSTWHDYDQSILSDGGCVFNRSDKSVVLNEKIKKLFNIDTDTIKTNTLINLILTANVDMIWNGGIGTYVKSSEEKNSDLGDKMNESLRVNAKQLKCKIFVEGGNLGFTQKGRIEYALNGGRIYCDFIDNSAGVDCSDHEVNAKILFAQIMSKDTNLTLEKRNQILKSATSDIAKLVLNDNIRQTRAIDISVHLASKEKALYRSYLDDIENKKLIDRNVDSIPSNKTLNEREQNGQWLCAPEMAMIMSHSKIALRKEIMESAIINDAYLNKYVYFAFPEILREKFASEIQDHILRKEIIATVLSNSIINSLGVTFIYRIKRETYASISAIIRAYIVVKAIFDLENEINFIQEYCKNVTASKYSEIFCTIMWQITRMIRRSSRWFIRHKLKALSDIDQQINYFAKNIEKYKNVLCDYFIGNELNHWDNSTSILTECGMTYAQAKRISNIRRQYTLLDIIEISKENSFEVVDVIKVYFIVSDIFNFAWLREKLTDQRTNTEWDTLARINARDDVDAQQKYLTIKICKTLDRKNVTHISSNENLKDVILSYLNSANNKNFYDLWQKLLVEIKAIENIDLLALAAAIRNLNSLLPKYTQS